MKTCEICKIAHERQGHRTCGSEACLHTLLKRKKAKLARLTKKAIYESLGMTKVKGAMGGTYWE